MTSRHVRFLTMLAAAGAAAAPLAEGAMISTSPHALGGGRVYASSGPALFHIDSFFDVFVDFTMLEMGGSLHVPGSGFGNNPDNLCLVVAPAGSGGGAPSGEIPVSSIDSFFDVFFSVSPDGHTQTFDTEMLQMNLGGPILLPTLPPPYQSMLFRESPSRPSLGRYTVESLPGGDFRIDSFFDVFTELSIDGGQTWIEAQTPLHLTLIPAPGAAGVLALGGLLAANRRRRR